MKDPEKKERNEREPTAMWLAKYQKVIGGGEGNLQVFKWRLGRGGPEKKERTEKEEPRAGW